MKILIVGASGAIGRSVVNLLAVSNGNIVLGTSRSGEPREMKERENVFFYPLDVTDKEKAAIQVLSITKNEPVIDAIVIASGVLKTSFSLLADNETEQMQINFLMVIEILKTLIRKYITRGLKSVVLVASSSASNADGGRLGYNSSKAALIAAGKTLARELGPKGVRVNCVSPGLIESEMVDRTISSQQLNSLKERLFLERIGEADEVAKAIRFLVSEESSYITGQNICVDGGMSW